MHRLNAKRRRRRKRGRERRDGRGSTGMERRLKRGEGKRQIEEEDKGNVATCKKQRFAVQSGGRRKEEGDDA